MKLTVGMENLYKNGGLSYPEDLRKPAYDKGLLLFLGLVFITLGAKYFAPEQIATFWYLSLLVMYFISDDEPVWLAFFLVTMDGFAGFFGIYSINLRVLPGLPVIELSQFYILLSVIKVFIRRRYAISVFYRKYLQLLAIYFLFMIIWGMMMGLTGGLNIYLRVLKLTLPFLLLYSLPRLMRDLTSYKRFYGIIFIVILIAFATQIFTLLTGVYPIENVVDTELSEESGEFRTFYNATGTLTGFLGALFFFNIKGYTGFKKWFLGLVIFSCLMMAVISATRGWIISFSVILILSILFTRTMNFRNLAGVIALSAVLILLGMNSERIREQIEYSRERLLKIESIGSGDLTAEGSMQRLTERSPRVMKAWKENPFFGWGFSDYGFIYGDGHVGNQNLLMFSGIVGFLLINGFLVFLAVKFLIAYRKKNRMDPLSNTYLIIVIYMAGWFIIHSTSGQQFAFSGLPIRTFPQAIFLGVCAVTYRLYQTEKKKLNK